MFISLSSVWLLVLLTGSTHFSTASANELETNTESPCESSEEHSTSKKCPGDHEVFVDCLPTCPSRTCDYYLNRPKCPEKRNASSKRDCSSGCQCQNGYYRHAEGMCVTDWRCKLSSSDPQWKNSAKKSRQVEAYNLFIRGNLAFTGKLFVQMIQECYENLFVASGAAVLYLLAEVLPFTTGESYKQIRTALNLQDVEQVRSFFHLLTVSSQSQQYVHSRYISKLYVDDQYGLTEKFENETKEVFINEPCNIAFCDPESAKIVNEEVANATDGRITTITSSRYLSSLSSILMVNAEAFRGPWEYQFNPKNTKNREFRKSECESVRVPTMYQRGKFLYTESAEADATVLKMRYKGGNYTCAIVLPNQSSNIEQVVKKLANPDIFISTFNSLRTIDVEVYLPSFSITKTNRMKKYVEKANVTSIFNNETAGLEEITKNGKPFVNQIVEKIIFEVNEFGTLVSNNSSSDNDCSDIEETESNEQNNKPEITFKANRPFLFYFLHKKIVWNFGVYYGS